MPPTAPPTALRYAWWGRTAEDPNALLRQHHLCRQAVAPAPVTAHFWTVGSGHAVAATRRPGHQPPAFLPIPYDGGLQELLAAAHDRDRPFDAVVVISLDRLSRRPGPLLAAIQVLRSAQVPVHALVSALLATGFR